MALPRWLPPLAAILLVQVVISFQSQALWIMGPILTRNAGVEPERIGELAALVALGSAWFFMSGNPILARLGAIRSLQTGLALVSCSLLFFFLPVWPVMMAATFLIGIGYGPTAPAGSDVLSRYAPARHKSIVFSIKQAGSPLGGAIAGLTLPSLALAVGWQWAILLCSLIGLACIALIQPVRAFTDAERDRKLRISPRLLLAPSNMRQPLAVLGQVPSLPYITGAAVCFALIQGNLFSFTVTYLHDEVGLSLARAGIASAALQISGVAGRIVMGWLADRLGNGVGVMKGLAVSTMLLTFAMSTITADWSFAAIVALSAVTGSTAATWNGVMLAEVARVAPKGKIGLATAGSAFFTFLGYTAGPVIFAALVHWNGSYGKVFAGFSLLGLVALALLMRAKPHVTEA